MIDYMSPFERDEWDEYNKIIENNASSIILNYLFIIVPFNYLEKIKSRGLVPKTINPMCPSRIYLSEDNLYLEDIIDMFYKNTKINDWLILQIDRRKMHEDMHFYKNHHFLNGIYTMENIHPSTIEIYKKVTF
jgi:hypothetical protein